MVGKMDYLENILYRKQLDQKVFDGQKLSAEEKRWCLTNPLYNERWDFPCYKKDIIKLEPKKWHSVKVTFESSNFLNEKIIPIISIPVGEGEIKLENFIPNTVNDSVVSKKIKAVGIMINNGRQYSLFSVKSNLGFMSVAYQCEYFDSKMNVYKREISQGAQLTFGMKKEKISENKFLYYCKSGLGLLGDFNAFVFSVELK